MKSAGVPNEMIIVVNNGKIMDNNGNIVAKNGNIGVVTSSGDLPSGKLT